LTIDSDAVISADGTLAFGPNGKLVIKGTSDFETDGKIFPATGGPLDFEIDHNGVVTLHETRSLNGQILITNGVLRIKEGVGITATDLELTTNGSITLNSLSTTYSSLIVDNITNNGTIQYNRHVDTFNDTPGATTGQNDLISAPVTNGTQTFGVFRAVNSNIPSGNVNGVLSFLFGPFDNNNASNPYTLYTTGNDGDALVAGVGYRTASTNTSTFTFVGDVETGTVPVDISVGTAFEWNLIGNPYPSYIDSAAFLTENAASLDEDAVGIYGYDGDAPSGWTILNFNTANSTDYQIAPGQGFLVAAEGSSTINFTPEMRSVTGDDDFIAGRMDNDFLRLKLESGENDYNTDFYFNDNSTRSLDPGYDAGIFNASLPDFYIYSHLVEGNSGRAMAIQSLGSADVSDVIVPIGVNANQGEQLTFTIDQSTLDNNIAVYLDDTDAHTSTLLTAADYTLTPNEALNGVGRFYLRFGDAALSTTGTTLNDLNIYTNQKDQTIVINGLVLEATTARVFDLQGRLVNTIQLESSNRSQTIDVSHLSSGVYVVQLSNSQQRTTKKVILR
jgi:hypothetical protein